MDIRITFAQYCNWKKSPQEMVKNVMFLKQIGENAMMSSSQGFNFKKAILLKIHTMIALKNTKLYHLSKPVTRKCQQLQKTKINLSVKFLHASITER